MPPAGRRRRRPCAPSSSFARRPSAHSPRRAVVVAGVGKVEVPPGFDARAAAGPDQALAGRQASDAFDQRTRRDDAAVGEHLPQRVDIGHARDESRSEDRLGLGAEHQRAAGDRVVHRLDADAVADQQQLVRPRVPQRDREHPAQRVDEPVAALLVEVDDDFGVRSRPEAVAARRQVRAQRRVVVDLAVAHGDDIAVLRGDRLVAGGEVDDREAAESQADAGGDVEAFAVRAAMAQRVRHAPEHRRIRGLRRVGRRDAGDAAHGVSAPRARRHSCARSPSRASAADRARDDGRSAARRRSRSRPAIRARGSRA